MSIVLHIERLVLDEALVGSERPGAMRMAIEHELLRQLAQPATAERLRNLGAVDELPTVALPAARYPREHLGSRVAIAVRDGLGVPIHTRVPGPKRS
jgi:hypothetical protein